MYSPDLVTPVVSPDHVRNALGIFSQRPEAGELAPNRQLLTVLNRLLHFQGYDTNQMMSFLYDGLTNKTQPDGQSTTSLRGEPGTGWKRNPFNTLKVALSS